MSVPDEPCPLCGTPLMTPSEPHECKPHPFYMSDEGIYALLAESETAIKLAMLGDPDTIKRMMAILSYNFGFRAGKKYQ